MHSLRVGELFYTVGRQEISQDGLFRFSARCFVNNDYVTAEIIYSSAHVHREIYATFEIIYSTMHVNHEVVT